MGIGRPEREQACASANSEWTCHRQQRERAHACHRSTRSGKLLGPNGLKLSDGGWRRKTRNTKKDSTASLRSLERVVRALLI